MLLVGEYAFAFVVRERLVNIGTDVKSIQIDPARHRFPCTVPRSRTDVLGKYYFRVVMAEILGLRPTPLHAAIEDNVARDLHSLQENRVFARAKLQIVCDVHGRDHKPHVECNLPAKRPYAVEEVASLGIDEYMDDGGVTMIEYGLIAALVGVACVVVLTTLGGDLQTLFGNVSTAVNP